ncbi:MAG TPA: hypothetical protein VF582_03730 [Allosphingosinicella sp.]
MNRPFTRRQSLQNARFLDALAQTGNARLAAQSLGVHRATYTKRRAKDASFAARWEAALAAAHARFHLSGGTRPPILPGTGRGTGRRLVEGGPRPTRSPPFLRTRAHLKTQGGEPTIVRRSNGKLQLRLAPPGRMTKAGEQAFLRALAASANIRLSARAAGFAHSSFYAKKRKAKPFAREMRLAHERGYDQLECALLASGLQGLEGGPEDETWRNCEPLPVPPMTVSEAIQLLSLHEKSVRQSWEQPHRRKRRNESDEAYVERLRAMWVAEKAREAEAAAIRRAAQYEATGDWRFEDEMPLPELPPLQHVTGWSKASGKPKHNPKRAMFGGWRIDDLRKRQRKG